MKSLFELNGGTYSAAGDYRLPDLANPSDPENHIGIWGQRRLDYQKNHLTSFKKKCLNFKWISGIITQSADASVAQLVEQRIRNAQVVGSSPTGSSSKKSQQPCGFADFFAFFNSFA